jgi:two-component system chemotaxis sensor kinase CheA
VSDQLPTGIDADLLDDFFGEADEHLVNIRQEVLRLEAFVGKAQVDPQLLEELFQNIHSFKGISAIVGLGPAEALSHATEDYLRAMRGGKISLTEQGLEVLMNSAQKLEQIVAAFRARNPLPGYESLLIDLRRQVAEPGQSSSRPTGTSAPGFDTVLLTRIEEEKSRGRQIWKYTFVPSRELDARGINVNAMREEFSKLGEILKATPQIRGKGSIAFEFLVAARDAPADISAWEAKGVTVQLEEIELPGPESSASKQVSQREEAEHNPFLAPSHVVRVDLNRLDDLMRITGEMVIHRSRLDTQLSRLNGSARVDLRGVQEVSGGLSRSLRELREAIMRVRLVPVAEIFARMPFVVRDLSRQTQKKVRLKLVGQDTAVDKYLIERLKDPLLHLVRNAFSHGVETPEERLAAGKQVEGVIELKASTIGDSVIIQVADDGKGIDRNAVVQRAKSLGLEVPEQVDEAAILNILCSSGFSTRENADLASGRGVGMAVVYSTVRELGGNLTLESEEGHGTQFTIRLPLTLAIAEAFIISAAGQTCAIPQSFIREILHIAETDLQVVNGIEAIRYREGVLPVTRLAKLFRLRPETKPKSYVLVVTSDRGSVGLLVDAIIGQREIVVSSLHDPLIQVEGISGATELGDGKPVLILDGAALTSGVVRPRDEIASPADRLPATVGK